MATDIKKLVSEMTLEEKVSLLGGKNFWTTKAVERLGIPEVFVSDGPHGLRKQDLTKSDHLGLNDSIEAVCFPAGCATASSFDKELIRKMGETIGNEAQAENIAVVLGPAVNIKRSPLCGRNFEYLSEDPYLAGEMAASYIQGVQSQHVGTSIKHFAANNQEYYRMSNNTVATERTLREIYFPAFETAVKKAQPWTVMCSYNKINGTYSADNEWLLTKVLRDDWGFKGYVMTDWGAINDRVQGLRAGLDLEMPGNTAANDAKVKEAVENGTLSMEAVDQAVERILKIHFEYLENRNSKAVFDREHDHQIAAEAAAECSVLLKNNGILPLQETDDIVYIGEYAASPRYQGGGSSHINSSRVVSALEAATTKGRKVRYVKGFPAQQETVEEAEIQEAVEAARAAKVAVIFAGLPDRVESEGYDRKDMNLPEGQNELIRRVLAVQPNTVVVLHNGSPVAMPWAEDVGAILEMYLGGQGVGTATDELLFGEKNPSGKLAETFPLRVEDNPSYLNFNNNPETCVYAEGVYVGYRYYEKKQQPVRFAFGHGLSYTTFSFSNLRVSKDTMTEEETIAVSVDVTNTGDRYGKEVVQLYIADQTGTPDRPVKELKGFEKVGLEPGETKTVTMTVDFRSLAYFEEKLGDWYAKSGNYAILIGDASDNIALSTIILYTTTKKVPMRLDGSITVGELLANDATRPIVQGMMQQAASQGPIASAGEMDDMMKAMMLYMPLKSLKSFGVMDDAQLQGLLMVLGQALSE